MCLKSGKVFKAVEYVSYKANRKVNRLSSLDASLYSCVLFLFLRWLQFGRKERRKRDGCERMSCKGREILLLPCKTRSLAKVLIRWVDRHVKNEGSDVFGLLEMIV